MAEKPEFKEITVKDPADATDGSGTVIGKDGISVKGKDGADAISLKNKDVNGTETPSLEFANNKGAVKGLEDRKATDSRVTDYGTGANANRAATEGALKDLADKLGIDNSTPTPLDTKQLATPAGKDGLTGANGQPKSYKDQINALRDGTAGNTVYTDSNGNRLKKANNGNYYLADQVDENGNVKEANPPITPATDVMISNVNTDGSTTAPIKTGNIASGLGLDSTAAGNAAPVTEQQAKDALNGKDGKPGLLAQTGNSLNNAATVKDLQALAQAGLDFTGNNNTEKTLHRPLGSKLVVEGETSTAKNNTNITKQAFGATAADNIHVEAKVDGDTNKLVVRLTEDLKNINSLTTKPHDNGDGTQTTTKLTPEGTKVSKVKPSADPATPAEEVESANYGLNTEMTKTAADGTKTTSVSSADGNTMLEEKPDGTVTKSEETAAGTTLEQRLPDGKVKNAEYTVDGNKVSEKAADGTSKETVTNAGGTTVVEKDANDIPTKSAEYTADGSKVTAYDPATGNPKAESKYGADGLSTKALDPATGKVTGETTVTPTGVNLYGKDGKDGKDGKPGEPVASLTNNVDAAGKNNPTLAFAKEPVTENGAPKTDEYGNPVEKGTGSITGLKDLERNPDGTAKDKTAAANAGYVDDRIAAADAGKPFEYFEKDADGNVKVDPVTGEAAKLERGRDGKFYPAGYLKDKTYDPKTNTYTDINGTPIPTDKVVDSNNITVQAMPSPTGNPIEMGNVGSGLGLDDSVKGNEKALTADQAKEAMNGTPAKDGQPAKPGLLAQTGNSLNNAATVKDLQALAQAGLDFTGNNNTEKTLHRPLGSKLVVEGETDKTDVTKTTFGATAKDNIHVEAKEVADGDKKINKLVVSLSEDLKGINSLTTKPVKNADGTETTTKLTSEGTKVSKVKPAVVDPATGTVTTPAEEVESANYGLNTEMKKTAEDGTVTTSTSNAGGTVLTEKTPDGKETISVETVGGTSISEKDAAGNETRAAKYDLDGTKVTSKDPATGITKETTTGVDGTNVALKDANNPNNDKSSNYGVDGTELRAKDEQGNPIAADYKVDGATVVAKDPVTGETKETTLKPDGTYATIKDAAGNPTKSSNYTADGSTVKNIDPATGKPTTESKYGADGLSTKALDPNTGEVTGETTVTPTGVNLYGKDGKDGKDAQPIASLTNTVDADGNNNPTLSFAKDEAGNGTGSITGLKDLETNPDGTAKDRTAAVNAGYVDDKIGALDSKLNNTKKDLSGGIAGAVAMANLPQVRDIAPHKHNIAAAYGHYGSQHALALGISGISDNERAIYKASVALDSRGKTAFGVGVGYQIDAREDLYGENIIDRLNKLNAENIGMKRENEEFRGVINKLLQDVENLKKNQK